MSFGIILSPHSIRDTKHISEELEWVHTEENQLGSVATGSGSVGTEDTTLMERVEPSSLVAAGDRLPLHLSSSKIVQCLGDARTSTQSSNVLVQKPEQV